MSKPDVNFYSLAHLRGGHHVVEIPAGLNPLEFDDILKITDCQDITVEVRGVLPGGREDCIDINNHCRNVTVWVSDGMHPNGNYAATIKGGSSDIEIIGKLLSHGKVVDFDLGNHSDQSDNTTREVSLMVESPSGDVITWRRLNATTPHLKPGQRWKRKFKLPGELRELVFKVYAFAKKHLRLPI